MDGKFGMTDKEITFIALNHTPSNRYFGGVFPCDLIPHPPHRFLPIYYIVNTGRSSTPGVHWLLLFIFNINEKNVCFDSLGVNLNNYDIILSTYINENLVPYEMNRSAVQQSDSSQCGQFCLSVGDMLCHGSTFDRIVNMFTPSPSVYNEIVVDRYVRGHMMNQRVDKIQIPTPTLSPVPYISSTSTFMRYPHHHQRQHHAHHADRKSLLRQQSEFKKRQRQRTHQQRRRSSHLQWLTGRRGTNRREL